jgi:hypothetical protein
MQLQLVLREEIPDSSQQNSMASHRGPEKVAVKPSPAAKLLRLGAERIDR